jgi:hypothetical protein
VVSSFRQKDPDGMLVRHNLCHLSVILQAIPQSSDRSRRAHSWMSLWRVVAAQYLLHIVHVYGPQADSLLADELAPA